MRLGVNVDHVATIRQARKASEPDPVMAARACEKAGCDSIVCHLREDRRHINDADLIGFKKAVTTKLNLEMSVAKEIVDIARRVKPDQATLVPERRQEVTTEGGLDVVGNEKGIRRAVQKLKNRRISVSLFVDPEKKQIDASKRLGVDAVELHTGRYANARSKKARARQLEILKKAAAYASKKGLKVYAGHGLTYENVKKITGIPQIEELNIGHSIISRSVFDGLGKAVRKMKALIK